MGGIQRGPHFDVPPPPQVQAVLQLGSEGPGPPRPPFRDELMAGKAGVEFQYSVTKIQGCYLFCDLTEGENEERKDFSG